MLKISIELEVNGKKNLIPLPPVKAGERGGSITDYGVKGTRILHFFHPSEGKASLEASPVGASIEQGNMRMTIPFAGLEVIKILEPNKVFRFPYQYKHAKAELILELEPNRA